MFIDHLDKIEKDFQSEYLCKPFLDENWDRIRKAVQEYHEKCDEFDDAICSSKRHGISFPINAEERRLINIHALKVREDVCRSYKIDSKQLQEGFNHWHER
jgi:Mg2+ and Co2+ transporter CorA